MGKRYDIRTGFYRRQQDLVTCWLTTNQERNWCEMVI